MSDPLLSTLMTRAHALVWSLDADGVIQAASESHRPLLGRAPAELVGIRLTTLLTTDPRPLLQAIPRAAGGEQIELRTSVQDALGQGHPFTISLCPGTTDDVAVIALAWPDAPDTDLARLRRALREKDSLLQEVRHRVNNNLTLMSGLLLLQTTDLADDAARTALASAQRRLDAMALTHRLLYTVDDLSEVELGGYLRALVNNLHAALNPPGRHISVEFDTEPVAVSLQRAVPCALILNELITNVFKHAFRERDGTIRIRCRRKEGDTLALEVHDDGPGLPEGFSLSPRRSLGTRLIRMLAEQLDADLAFGTSEMGGAKFSLEFDIHRP
ncbi:MAG: histidine kinase dimerization/phosphoacceptor domain -containing protein [Myxococcota bacterium]